MEKLTFDETTQLVDLIEKLKDEACDENKEKCANCALEIVDEYGKSICACEVVYQVL